MSGAVATSAGTSFDALGDDLPLLGLLRHYSNKVWNREHARLVAETFSEASHDRIRRVRIDDELGQPAWAAYPAANAAYANVPLWVEGKGALLDFRSRDDETPIGILFLPNTDHSTPARIKARFVIRFGELPYVCPAHVLIDTRPAVGDDGFLTLLFADALRARQGLPTAPGATTAELLQMDDCAVELDGRYWVRTSDNTLGSERLEHAVGPNYPATESADAAEALRSALGRVVVESPNLDSVGGVVEGLDTKRVLFTLFRRVLNRGPYLALTALHLAALQLRK